jgi:hypothetical protein
MIPTRVLFVELQVQLKLAVAAPTEWPKAGSADPFAKGSALVIGSASALTAVKAELWRAASTVSRGPYHFKPSWLNALRSLAQMA